MLVINSNMYYYQPMIPQDTLATKNRKKKKKDPDWLNRRKFIISYNRRFKEQIKLQGVGAQGLSGVFTPRFFCVSLFCHPGCQLDLQPGLKWLSRYRHHLQKRQCYSEKGESSLSCDSLLGEGEVYQTSSTFLSYFYKNWFIDPFLQQSKAGGPWASQVHGFRWDGMGHGALAGKKTGVMSAGQIPQHLVPIIIIFVIRLFALKVGTVSVWPYISPVPLIAVIPNLSGMRDCF